MTSCSQKPRTPFVPMFTPVEEYRAAAPAERKAATISRRAAGSMPVTSAVRSGVHGAQSEEIVEKPVVWASTSVWSTPPLAMSSLRNDR